MGGRTRRASALSDAAARMFRLLDCAPAAHDRDPGTATGAWLERTFECSDERAHIVSKLGLPRGDARRQAGLACKGASLGRNASSAYEMPNHLDDAPSTRGRHLALGARPAGCEGGEIAGAVTTGSEAAGS
jgi:hypothetical protein